jgi:hypothetical protein
MSPVVCFVCLPTPLFFRRAFLAQKRYILRQQDGTSKPAQG